MHFILIRPVLSHHLSYVTIFQYSHKTGLTVLQITGSFAILSLRFNCKFTLDVNTPNKNEKLNLQHRWQSSKIQ